MLGSIVQLSISRGGVPKLPVPHAYAHQLGLEGDHQAHPQFHGGPRQALLLICSEVIAELAAAGFPVYPGALGENLTIQGIDHRELRVGQRFRAGEAFLELTKLREPCSQLKVYGANIGVHLYDNRAKAGDPSSPVWAKGGFYASVVRPGAIRQNDIIALVDQVV